jgi:esterase/lipase
MVARRTILTGLTSLLLGSVLIIGATSGAHAQYEPSGTPITAPAPQTAFSEYVDATRQQIRTVLKAGPFAHENKPFGPFKLDQVVDMRSPYSIAADKAACDIAGRDLAQGEKVGFLAVHGLTDSPYWLTDVRDQLRVQFPCAVFNGVILPGHGTVSADLIDVRYQDWIDTVRFGLDAFDSDITHIIPIGYSMGAALIGREVAERNTDPRISAMIMLSPGLAAKSEMAWLTPYVRYVKKWVGQSTESDPVKYSSMAMNAAAEFYLVTEPYRDGSITPSNVPLFAAISSDDQTVNPLVAVDYFCTKNNASLTHMIWYQGETNALDEHPKCDGIDVVKSANDQMRTINHAHTAITMSPENPVYGLDGVIRDCGHYSDPADQLTCKTGPDTVYGERNLVESATPGTLRRGTFNPDFGPMMDKMVTFVSATLGAPKPQ